MRFKLLICLSIMLLLSGCASQSGSPAAPGTQTAGIYATPGPTATPAPTGTPQAENYAFRFEATPSPTARPTPSPTPAPTPVPFLCSWSVDTGYGIFSLTLNETGSAQAQYGDSRRSGRWHYEDGTITVTLSGHSVSFLYTGSTLVYTADDGTEIVCTREDRP